MVNWNAVNNELSHAILDAGLLESLLHVLGCEPKENRASFGFRGRCPVHNGDGQNLAVKTEGEKIPIFWHCYSHRCHECPKIKPNLLGLVRGALTHCSARPASMREAQSFLERFISGKPQQKRLQRPQSLARRTPLHLTREQVRNQLVIPSNYFVNRGFDKDVLDEFDVGESRMLNRVVVPIYDNEGIYCINFISRSFKPTCPECKQCHFEEAGCMAKEPRWKFPENSSKSDWLYNFANAKRSNEAFVLLVEGAPDVFRAAEAGIPAVACFGVDPSVTQILKLGTLEKEIVVAFDNDNAGLREGITVATILKREGIRARLLHPPKDVKDVGEMDASGIKAWLAGRVQVAFGHNFSEKRRPQEFQTCA